MASRDDWLVTYRNFSDADLEAEIEMLDELRKNFLNTQAAGSKSFSVDRNSINDQYTAAIEVRGERSNSSNTGGSTRMGTTDYYNVTVD